MPAQAPSPTPLQVGTDTGWAAAAAGASFSLAVKRDGTLWGWGRNEAGQLGLGPLDRRVPVRMP